MAGRIRDEDIALVREKTPIADIIGEHVQLRNAGGGNLKGICPFHDEKSPSLSVSPARGLYHCFGCGAGGDVIRFVQNIEHLDFTDAVERLAGRSGIQLRYLEGSNAPKRVPGQRGRLVEAHAEAQRFYAEQLRSPEALAAREFLAERGFDQTVAEQFGCGFAPAGWDALTKHLLAKNFTPQELTIGGLSRESARGGLIDRFHRRLLWPIRDTGGDVVGFGARRLFDDDKVEAKYLNTPETPIYKKSQLLYGVDMAKREIARQHRAVIVEGYTDVMACHLSGVTTAVATCGTAFGSEHVSVIRRLLMDSDSFTGEVIFTFDGDAAGMKAAERAFGDDQKFMAQTFVAIEPTGHGSVRAAAEVRRHRGARPRCAAHPAGRVRAALDGRALRSRHRRGTLDRARPRRSARRPDQGPRPARRVRAPARRPGRHRRSAARRATRARHGALGSASRDAGCRPSRREGGRGHRVGRARGAQGRAAAAGGRRSAVRRARAGGVPAAGAPIAAGRDRGGGRHGGGRRRPGWTERVEQHLDETLRSGVHALAVEPLRSGTDGQERYADAVLARMHEIVAVAAGGRAEVAGCSGSIRRNSPRSMPACSAS